MKIMLCKGQFLGPMSGADETLVNYATQLHKAGHSVSVLLLFPYLPQDEYYVRLRETGIPVHSIASTSSRTILGNGRKIARWLMSAFPSTQYLVRTNGQKLATNIALRYRKQCRDFLEQSCANIVHVLTPDPGGMVLISARRWHPRHVSGSGNTVSPADLRSLLRAIHDRSSPLRRGVGTFTGACATLSGEDALPQ
jgi:hypothetical protein